MRFLRRVVVVLLVGSRVAVAQPVHGRVTDARGRGVAGAIVTVEGAASGVTTNSSGDYTIDVGAGASLVVSADGYGVGLATAEAADVILVPESTSAETIEVHGDPPPQALGAARLDRTDIERIPGGGNDLMRSLSAMPGVVDYPLPLGSSGVVIRGSSPQDSKIL